MLPAKRPSKPRDFDTLLREWQRLAERRCGHLRELQRSPRWNRYFTQEELDALRREADEAVARWSALSPPSSSG